MRTMQKKRLRFWLILLFVIVAVVGGILSTPMEYRESIHLTILDDKDQPITGAVAYFLDSKGDVVAHVGRAVTNSRSNILSSSPKYHSGKNINNVPDITQIRLVAAGCEKTNLPVQVEKKYRIPNLIGGIRPAYYEYNIRKIVKMNCER